jgi:hypothetical protein
MDYYATGTSQTAHPSRITSPRLLTILQVLFGLNALLWLVSYLTSINQLRQAGIENNLPYLVITGLMGGNAIAMLVAGVCLTRKCKLYLYFTASVVLFNILLAVADHWHFLNPLILLIDLLILALLPLVHTTTPVYLEE